MEYITLGIESSCDESGVAIYSNNRGLLANELFSQIKLHKKYNGVVPEIAARDHIKRIYPLIKLALNNAKIKISAINGIAYTKGPGLAGALLTGSSIAKSLAFALNIDVIGINHMEGHLLASMLNNKIQPPFIALLVSGGHTMLIDVTAIGDYNILGQSVDDAVGEAFDKTAKILGLGYPGGAKLAQLAQQGDKKVFNFPRPMINKKTLNFSFSGLKTFAKNTFAANPDKKADIAIAFEEAAIDVLINKTKKALKQTNYNTLIMGGGVASNIKLRNKLTTELVTTTIIYPPVELCTDNGAMIAFAGSIRLIKGEKDKSLSINIKPRWPLNEI